MICIPCILFLNSFCDSLEFVREFVLCYSSFQQMMFSSLLSIFSLIRQAVREFDEVPDLPASAGALYAAADLIGSACSTENEKFMLCKGQSGNPVDCVSQGVAVTRCAGRVLKGIVSSPCAQLYKEYVAVLEKNNLEFHRALKQEKAFQECIAKQKI